MTISSKLPTGDQQNSQPTQQQSNRDPYKFNRLAQAVLKFWQSQGKEPLNYQGRFYLYCGTHYRDVENLNIVVRQAFDSIGIPQSNNVIGNVVPIIESTTYTTTEDIPSLPHYSGNDPKFPPVDSIIPFANGLLDMREGEGQLRGHTPRYYSLFSLPFDYEPAAKCPEWLSFQDEVFSQDQERIRLLQEWFGYCLTSGNNLQKALLKLGPPRAGKGTTDNVLKAIVGEEYCVGFNLGALSETFGLRRLVGKQVATIGEVTLNSKDKRQIFERWNSVIGGDSQPIEWKGKNDSFSQVLPVKFSVCLNELPAFNDPSGALASRLLILRYDRCHVGSEDRGLLERLLTEKAGIANWAVEGYRRLKRQGKFSDCASSAAEVAMYQRDNSHVMAFMQDCCEIAPELASAHLPNVTVVAGVETNTVEFAEAFEDWCEIMEIPLWATSPTSQLLLLIPELRKKERHCRGRQRNRYDVVKQCTRYFGVGLKEYYKSKKLA